MLALFVLTYVKELRSTWQHGVDSVAFYLVKVISALRSMSDKWGNLVAARAGWMDAEEERRRNESWTSQRIAVRHFAFLNPLLWLFFFIRYRFDTISDRKEKRMGVISLIIFCSALMIQTRTLWECEQAKTEHEMGSPGSKTQFCMNVLFIINRRLIYIRPGVCNFFTARPQWKIWNWFLDSSKF